MTLLHIVYSTAVRHVEQELEFEITKHTIYLTLTAELCGVYCMYYGESLCVIKTSHCMLPTADSKFKPSQWETALHCNDVSHWLGASLESALLPEVHDQNWLNIAEFQGNCVFYFIPPWFSWAGQWAIWMNEGQKLIIEEHKKPEASYLQSRCLPSREAHRAVIWQPLLDGSCSLRGF